MTRSSRVPSTSSIGRHGVEGVQLIEIDIVGAEPAQAPFDGPDQVMTRRSDVIGCRD